MDNKLKSTTTAGLLGIFLGSVGAHNWYLGEKKKGIIHVSLVGAALLLMIIADFVLPATLSLRTALSAAGMLLLLNSLAGLLISGSSIWGFVEGIIILSKGDAGLAARGFAVVGAPMSAVQQPVAQTVTGQQDAQSGSNVTMGSEQTVNTVQAGAQAQPVVQMKPPKQPMDSAKKKKIIMGVVIGAAAVVVAVAAVVVVSMLLKVDYGETYKVAKELKPEVVNVYRNTNCENVIDYAESTYTRPADYNEYADGCLAAGGEISELTKKLGETAGVKRNKEIKAQFDKFSEGVNTTLPDKSDLEKKLAIYKAWHEFQYLRDDIRASSADSEVQSAVAPLVNSGNDTLKTYGEGWMTSVLKLTQAYRNYDNMSYSDPNKSSARVAYQDAQTEHNNWTAANKPDIKQLGGLNFDNNTKMYNEWTKLYDMIRETYMENYNEGSGDCSEFLGEVYCD